MSALNDLVCQINDSDLREKIQKEIDKMVKQKKFGLVFEEHLPECTPLWNMPIRRGTKVALKAGPISDLYYVVKVNQETVACLRRGETETIELLLNDVVPVAEFGDPIYPYLEFVDSVCHAPGRDLWHTLIEADNYHALQLLEYLYAGKVDCIYIDPPYNTGARDWKYNNDYVDNNDQYRHSKWLSMMQKRLVIAKKLLNPLDSVLIVTIDEKEYLHLGCLLEELFPEANIQMISSIVAQKGVYRKGAFYRTNEFIFFVQFGNSQVNPLPLDEQWQLGKNESAAAKGIVWSQLRRSGNGDLRTDSPNLFYPIKFSKDGMRIIGSGPALFPLSEHPSAPVEEFDDCLCVWPIKESGIEGRWQLSQEELASRLSCGYVKTGKRKENTIPISYLKRGSIQKIENNDVQVLGYEGPNHSVVVNSSEYSHEFVPGSQWNIEAHDATYQGSQLINRMFGESRFSYPKSLYAVHDTIRFFVNNKPNALVVDFFAGSGTTLHAVNLLNAEDGGARRCILVTNNEVADAEAKEMLGKGLKPGDNEWEGLGIARHVTWPRTVCAIEGHDIKGDGFKGNYLGSEIPMADGFEANAMYFKLGFLDKTAVALGMQFKEMIPLLWLKAGAHGECPMINDNPSEMLILPSNRMAILLNENSYSAFANRVNALPEIETIYINTDYDINYRNMVSGLNGKKTFQLYRDYLDNFRINYGRR